MRKVEGFKAPGGSNPSYRELHTALMLRAQTKSFSALFTCITSPNNSEDPEENSGTGQDLGNHFKDVSKGVTYANLGETSYLHGDIYGGSEGDACSCCLYLPN